MYSCNYNSKNWKSIWIWRPKLDHSLGWCAIFQTFARKLIIKINNWVWWGHHASHKYGQIQRWKRVSANNGNSVFHFDALSFYVEFFGPKHTSKNNRRLLWVGSVPKRHRLGLWTNSDEKFRTEQIYTKWGPFENGGIAIWWHFQIWPIW